MKVNTYTKYLFILLALTILTTVYIKSLHDDKIYIDFTINPGESLTTIASNLEKNDIIEDADFFIYLAKLLKIDRKIKSGTYRLTKHSFEYNILMKLYKGRVKIEKLTIPEGFNIHQIASRLKHQLDIDSIAFIKATKNKYLINKLKIKADNLEGFLYPDTYYLTRGMSPYSIIELMVKRFMELFPDTVFDSANNKLNKYEIITLASIIEKEAVLNREKPIIAGVFYNRLKKHYPLQSCATVLYALGESGRIIDYKDTEVNSPYNTYKHIGLPPGPICSPGYNSIIAAIYPEKTDYMFYVAKGDGSHIFTKTYKEHLNVQKRMKR